MRPSKHTCRAHSTWEHTHIILHNVPSPLRAHAIAVARGRDLMSRNFQVVAFPKEGQILVGSTAKRQAVVNPQRTVRDTLTRCHNNRCTHTARLSVVVTTRAHASGP